MAKPEPKTNSNTKSKTVQEVYDMLGEQIKEGNGNLNFVCTIPFRDGLGLHYEKVVNISCHSGLVDMHLTTPEHDDIEKKK
jgi:hypothetical protein